MSLRKLTDKYIDNWYDKIDKKEKWHIWFTWYPVEINCKYIWFKYIKRKGVRKGDILEGYGGYYNWEYKII